MTTKSIFDIKIPLRREQLLQLLRGNTVQGRGSPHGATMIEGVAVLSLHEEITAEERREMSDALTRDVPGGYSMGYETDIGPSAKMVGYPRPVAGTTAWLTMIASNADRIRIRVQTGVNTFGYVYLADATPDQQREAIRTWLAAGIVPEWEEHKAVSDRADELRYGDPMLMESPNAPPINLATCAPDDLERVGNSIGVLRLSFGGTRDEDDESYRNRVVKALSLRMEKEATSCHACAGTGWHTIEATAYNGMCRACGGTGQLSPPAPPPTPAFVPPPKLSPLDDAKCKVRFIRWLIAQSIKAGSEWALPSQERAFLANVEKQVGLCMLPSAKQTSWLKDLHSRAKSKAHTISHLLPAVPDFLKEK